MADHSGSLPACSQHLRSNPDSRDSSTGSYVRSVPLGSRYRHWNTMVAVECVVCWHLLGLSFSFPNWLESRDVRRHRSSLLLSSFWPISCSLFRLGLFGSLWDCLGRIWGMGS